MTCGLPSGRTVASQWVGEMPASHDCFPIRGTSMSRFSLIPSQVYLKFAKKATLFRHLLARLSDILAHELKCDMRREVEKEKRDTHGVTPDYARKPISSKRLGAWQVIWKTVFFIR